MKCCRAGILTIYTSIFINVSMYLSKDVELKFHQGDTLMLRRKTKACLIKALNKTKTEKADNEHCESNGLLAPFDSWHINRPLSRPTGGHRLH